MTDTKDTPDREMEFGDPNESGFRTIVSTMDPSKIKGATPSDFISAHVTSEGEGEYNIVLEYGIPIKSYAVAGMRGTLGEMKNIVTIMLKTIEMIEEKHESWEKRSEGD